MGKLVVCGQNSLRGEVDVQGSKNSVLPIMAASLLNAGVTVIINCPDIEDVNSMSSILEYLGCVINRDENTLIIDTAGAQSKPVTADMTVRLRASSILMGAMLARFGQVYIANPGGCRIGKRPIDIHLEALKRLGAVWEQDGTGVRVTCRRLTGNTIYLKFPSVGATENAVMAAVGAVGETVVMNAAKEPEVVELCQYLKKIGVKLEGEGTGRLVVWGGGELSDGVYEVGADRIVMGTYMAAVAACRGEVLLKKCCAKYARGFLDVYTGMGVVCRQTEQGLMVSCDKRCSNVNYISTGPYPGFPTDMQSITMSVAASSKGTVYISENIFEDRFKVAPWLRKMGADIIIEGSNACVNGVEKLKGTTVRGEDLRGTAALLVAGLAAEGTTVIDNADYILRGYACVCNQFRELGADIVWECS